MTAPHEIEVQNLHKYFGELEVLRGIDFMVDSGEVMCVVGPSGSGESTLLRCINRLEEPTSGRILVGGIRRRGRRPGRLHGRGHRHGRGTPSVLLENPSNPRTRQFLRMIAHEA